MKGRTHLPCGLEDRPLYNDADSKEGNLAPWIRIIGLTGHSSIIKGNSKNGKEYFPLGTISNRIKVGAGQYGARKDVKLIHGTKANPTPKNKSRKQPDQTRLFILVLWPTLPMTTVVLYPCPAKLVSRSMSNCLIDCDD